MATTGEKGLHRYLMSVHHYFRGDEFFEVEAENKQAALEAGKKYFYEHQHMCHGGNYNQSSIKVVKKLQNGKKNAKRISNRGTMYNEFGIREL